eukprot:6208044-Pleurochrysis_carterae.AAC.6
MDEPSGQNERGDRQANTCSRDDEQQLPRPLLAHKHAILEEKVTRDSDDDKEAHEGEGDACEGQVVDAA